MALLTRAQAEQRYGAIVNGIWKDEAKWVAAVRVPDGIKATYARRLVTQISCNRDMASALQSALEKLVARGIAKQFTDYGGCINVRPVRGATSFSWHSYGLAIDIDPAENPLGGKSHLTPEFIQCFKDAGFLWGGDFRGRKDPMHFQYAIG